MFHHGKDAYFSINAVDITAFIDSVDFPQSIDTAETSTMGTEAKTYIEGMSDATISIAGKWDETVTTGPDAVLSALTGENTFEFGPAGGAVGAVRYTGAAIRTGYNVSASIADVVAFTAEFQISGAITRDTFTT